MRIAIDPHMHRHLSLEALPHKVKELGFDWMELALRGDFLEWFKAPRVFPERVRSFKRALQDADVTIAPLLPMHRWASNDEVERLAAVRHWKRAIEICVELGVDTMNSEFGRGPQGRREDPTHPDVRSRQRFERRLPAEPDRGGPTMASSSALRTVKRGSLGPVGTSVLA